MIIPFQSPNHCASAARKRNSLICPVKQNAGLIDYRSTPRLFLRYVGYGLVGTRSCQVK